MVPKLFGLDMVDVLSEDWERVAHLAIGEVRDDDSIDMLLMLESGTLRYMLTLEAPETAATAPAPYQHLARFSREVLATNVPLIRRPSTVNEGFLLSIFPVRGHRQRVVYVLEPQATTPPGAAAPATSSS